MEVVQIVDKVYNLIKVFFSGEKNHLREEGRQKKPLYFKGMNEKVLFYFYCECHVFTIHVVVSCHISKFQFKLLDVFNVDLFAFRSKKFFRSYYDTFL